MDVNLCNVLPSNDINLYGAADSKQQTMFFTSVSTSDCLYIIDKLKNTKQNRDGLYSHHYESYRKELHISSN